MKTEYKRLTRNHRIEIEKQLALGKKTIEIARILGVHSTLR